MNVTMPSQAPVALSSIGNPLVTAEVEENLSSAESSVISSNTISISAEAKALLQSEQVVADAQVSESKHADAIVNKHAEQLGIDPEDILEIVIVLNDDDTILNAAAMVIGAMEEDQLRALESALNADPEALEAILRESTPIDYEELDETTGGAPVGVTDPDEVLRKQLILMMIKQLGAQLQAAQQREMSVAPEEEGVESEVDQLLRQIESLQKQLST